MWQFFLFTLSLAEVMSDAMDTDDLVKLVRGDRTVSIDIMDVDVSNLSFPSRGQL